MKKTSIDKADARAFASPQEKDINMTIDGETFSLHIEASAEALYRSSAGDFNKTIERFRAIFPPDTPGISEGHYRLMAGLEFALLYKKEVELRDAAPVEQRLEALCSEAEEFLQQQEQDELWQALTQEYLAQRK
ncbi:cell division protein ZapA [Porphyromonas gingivicanis]|uniref:cell division protein ZapA n=1 Tax=Porphyromonas gingivicanis TaxID=266762 RepID=UPI00046E7D01|nr:cell division protein ZapA [Porphyromonas gingivicanis]